MLENARVRSISAPIVALVNLVRNEQSRMDSNVTVSVWLVVGKSGNYLDYETTIRDFLFFFIEKKKKILANVLHFSLPPVAIAEF